MLHLCYFELVVHFKGISNLVNNIDLSDFLIKLKTRIDGIESCGFSCRKNHIWKRNNLFND